MKTAYRECETCHQRVITARGPDGGAVLNWQLDDSGGYAVMQTAAGAWIARKLAIGEPPLPYERRHSLHYATSPQCRPVAPEQRAAAGEVSDFLTDWRKAESANAAAKRNRRGRRQPAQTYLGFRRNP